MEDFKNCAGCKIDGDCKVQTAVEATRILLKFAGVKIELVKVEEGEKLIVDPPEAHRAATLIVVTLIRDMTVGFSVSLKQFADYIEAEKIRDKIGETIGSA